MKERSGNMLLEPIKNFDASMIMKFDRKMAFALDSYSDSNRLMFLFQNMSQVRDFLTAIHDFEEMLFKVSENEGSFILHTNITDRNHPEIILNDTSSFSTERDRRIAQQLMMEVVSLSPERLKATSTIEKREE
jgi:hypothetical protein